MSLKKSTLRVVGAAFILFWGTWTAPSHSQAASLIDGIPPEDPRFFKLNLDFAGGWATDANPNGSTYRWEPKLGGEFSIPGTGLSAGPLLSYHQIDTIHELGWGGRLDWLAFPINFSDLGLRFVGDYTNWGLYSNDNPSVTRNTFELGGVFDLSGAIRLGLWGGYDDTDKSKTLMVSAGADIVSLTSAFLFKPPYPTPDFSASATSSGPVSEAENPVDDSHVAIIISGGGSTGAWAVGALRYLLFDWPHPDPKDPSKIINGIGTHYGIVCGTSTGSLIAPLLMTNDPEQLRHNLDILREIYTQSTTGEVFTLNNPLDILGKGSVLENDGLKETINGIFNWGDPQYSTAQKVEEWLKADNQPYGDNYRPEELPKGYVPMSWNQLTDHTLGKKLIITTGCLQSSTAAYFYVSPVTLQTYYPYPTEATPVPERVRQYDDHMTVDPVIDAPMLMRAMLASASDPTLFPAVHVWPASGPASAKSVSMYSDGGMEDFAPIDIAAMNGATTIYAVILSPDMPETEISDFQDPVNALGRTIDLFSNRIGFANVEEAKIRHDLQVILKIKDKKKQKELQKELEREFKPDIQTLWLIRPTQNISSITPPGETQEISSNVFKPQYSQGWLTNGYNRAVSFLANKFEQYLADNPDWINESKHLSGSSPKLFEYLKQNPEKIKDYRDLLIDHADWSEDKIIEYLKSLPIKEGRG